ncbi:MAG TPA: hypothetical protein VMF51_17070 [Nocardioides sp.]|uniref:flavodoxin family protein n=1 Tax=Nocardioides sp. TaxID=35761 RepID=UPI002CC5EEC4|nr:hypothetical protein [Nocardioides sp.]HTW16848.1 hypothetical protein [Nocardioides sp.]
MSSTALVAHESMFGNTAAIAAAVARGLSGAGCQVDLVDVSSTDHPPRPLTSYDVLVLGAPTHAFSLSRASSRAEAVKQGASADRVERGLREWLAQLPPAGPHVRAAAFDTRVAKVRRLPGSAAAKAARQLRRRGYRLAADPASYYVVDTDGPLVDGELERAEAWGAGLAAG